MEKVLKEIQALERALVENMAALKLVETRLENRCQRPGMELCLDSVNEGLCEEVKQLQRMRMQLIEKLNGAKAIYSALEGQAARLDEDLGYKQHSLMTDIRTLDLRARLRGEAEDPSTMQFNRNIQLTAMKEQLPRH